MKASKKPPHANDEVQYASQLNSFFHTFDAGEHKQETKQVLDSAEMDFSDTIFSFFFSSGSGGQRF